MNIRKLLPNKKSTQENPLTMIRDSLDQLEQILNHHFEESEITNIDISQEKLQRWKRVLRWYCATIK